MWSTPSVSNAVAILSAGVAWYVTEMDAKQEVRERIWKLSETDHDFRVDVIVTPTEVVRTRSRKRPPGILWDHLDADKRAAIPVLEAAGAPGGGA